MRFTVNGRLLELSAEDVRLKLADVRPEPLHQYAIQIGLGIYPVKQAFEVATGDPRREFTTQVARRVFAALDFELIVDSGQPRAEQILQADVSDVVSSAASVRVVARQRALTQLDAELRASLVQQEKSTSTAMTGLSAPTGFLRLAACYEKRAGRASCCTRALWSDGELNRRFWSGGHSVGRNPESAPVHRRRDIHDALRRGPRRAANDEYEAIRAPDLIGGGSAELPAAGGLLQTERLQKCLALRTA